LPDQAARYDASKYAFGGYLNAWLRAKLAGKLRMDIFVKQGQN